MNLIDLPLPIQQHAAARREARPRVVDHQQIFLVAGGGAAGEQQEDRGGGVFGGGLFLSAAVRGERRDRARLYHGVGDAGFAAYIEGDDVTAFHVIDLVDDKGEQFLALQCLLLSSGARGRRIISWSLPFPSPVKGSGTGAVPVWQTRPLLINIVRNRPGQ